MRTSIVTMVSLLMIVMAFPASAGADDDVVTGTVAVGTGSALVEHVDHERHATPDDAVGIKVHATANPLPSEARFAIVTNCPPGMACAAIITFHCLVVYATPGGAQVPYAFEWATTEAEADVLFEDMPILFPSFTTGVPEDDPSQLMYEWCG